MRSRERRRALIALAGASALLGLGVGPSARAQDAPAGQRGEDLFGNYELVGHGQGVRVRYEINGLLPGGAPVLDLGLPESYARFASGPSGYGVASLAYPGGVIVNLPSLAEQGGAPAGAVPPYPIQAEAFYPGGPTEVNESQDGGTTQHVVTGDLGVDALASFPITDAPPAVKVGSVTTHVRTAIEDGGAVTRSRIVANDVAVLGGLITFDSVVTDLVAVHNGSSGSTSGGTTATGVQFLGLDSRFTDAGLVVDEAPPVEGPGAPLGGLLTPVVPGVGQALTPVQAALADALEQASPTMDEVLGMAGVKITLAEPTASTEPSGASRRESGGVVVELTYAGREQAALGDLIASIPAELKPDLGPVANPVNYLAENHIGAIGIAPAAVSALATPPFPDFEVPAFDVPVSPGSFDPGATSPGDQGFSTPAPALPPAGAGGDGLGLAGEDASSALSGALSALLVFGVVLLSPLFGLGSTKLADNVLAPVSTSCPTGQDKPPPARLT